MSKEQPTNIAASIRQRLLNLAQAGNEDFQLVLIRYGLERLLYRISQSEHRDLFVLKGALLFQLWSGQPHRATLDMDLLSTGEDTVARFEGIFKDICRQSVPDDGLIFAVDDGAKGSSSVREITIPSPWSSIGGSKNIERSNSTLNTTASFLGWRPHDIDPFWDEPALAFMVAT